MNLDNATQIILEGQRTIGLKTQDVDKLSVSSQSSSFTVDNSLVQEEVSGGQTIEDHTINTSVIDSGEMPGQVQSIDVQGGETVIPESRVQVSEEPQDVQNNIFDVPGDSFVQPEAQSILKPAQSESVNQPISSVSIPEYSIPTEVTQLEPEVKNQENIFDVPYQTVPEATVIPQKVIAPESSVYQSSLVQDQRNGFEDMASSVVNNQIPLDTPQTFYERQVEQEGQGGFTNAPVVAEKSESSNYDPVVIMLDEAIKTVNERSKVTDSLNNENQILRNQNETLKNENELLKQQIMELNNKVLIAEAQRQAAEQTLAGARMAESGMVNNGPVRTYQPASQVPQNNYYQQTA